MEKSVIRFILLSLALVSLLGRAEEPAPVETPTEAPVETPVETPVVTEVPSAPAESQLVVSPPDPSDPWRAGFLFSGLGAFSTVDYEPEYSGGLGWSIGLQVEKKLGPKARCLASFGYQSLSIGRLVSSSGGVIQDPYSQYIQTQTGPFLQGLVGVPFEMGHLDFGVEYFQPTSARQTASNSSEYEFKPSKFLFVIAGPSLSWKVRGEWELEGYAWFFMNTVGESQFRLMGGRLGLALRTPL